MIPTCYDPVIAEGGRRCERCGLLPEEHPTLVHVAYLDTGGISYSSAEYAAAAQSAEDARAAVYAAWDASPARGDHPDITTPEALHEWFGIKVWAMPLDGAAVRVD